MIQSCFQAGSRLIHLRPPIDVEDEQYAVEAILDHHNVGRSHQFLVHWEGYSDTEDSWVKEILMRKWGEFIGEGKG